MSEVTRILSAIEAGDPSAAGELLPLAYEPRAALRASVRRHRSAPQPGGASDHQERLEPSSRQPAMMDVINATEGDRIGSVPDHSEYWNQGRKKLPFKAATTG